MELYNEFGHLRSAVTGSGGYYRFDGLAGGSYFLEFTAPALFLFAQPDQGGDDRFLFQLDGDRLQVRLNDAAEPRWTIAADQPARITVFAMDGDDAVNIPDGLPSVMSLRVIGGSGNNTVHVGGGQVWLTPEIMPDLGDSSLPISALVGNFALTAAGASDVTMHPGTGVTVLNIRDQARVNVRPDVSSVLRLRGLSISGQGVLDLGGCDLVVGSAAAEAELLFQVNSLIAAGRSGPAGIISSAAPDPLKSLAARVVAASAAMGAAALEGAAVLVRYTWTGDANLDGIVNADDYFLIDQGFIAQSRGWQRGDFNYDQAINADDYFLIDQAFIGQTGPLGFRDDPLLGELFGDVPVL